MYFPWTLSTVAEVFSSCPEVEWLTSASNVLWDVSGRAFTNKRGEGFNRKAFYRGRNAGISGFHAQFIQQESTFWRISLWNKVGAHIDTTYSIAGDFDLWARFWEYADLYCTSALLSGFRVHDGQRTKTGKHQYLQETAHNLKRYNPRIPGRLSKELIRLFIKFPLTRRIFGWPTLWVDYDFQDCCWHTSNKLVSA